MERGGGKGGSTSLELKIFKQATYIKGQNTYFWRLF